MILGGARSGKSGFARSLAARSGGKVCFIATAEAKDAEMRERIERHRKERPKEWDLIEMAGGTRLERFPSGCQVILLDCLTVYLSNLILESGLDRWEEENLLTMREVARKAKEVVERILLLVDDLRRRAGVLIVVSNEVGMGVVPSFRLGRLFRDLAGQLNQRLANEADEVYLVVAGLPLPLKGSEAQNHRGIS